MVRSFPRLAPVLAMALLAGCIPGKRKAEPVPAPPPPADTTMPAEPNRPVPETPTAWQSRPVVADAVTVKPADYVVERGDTLRRIAEKTKAGSEAIARENGLAAPFTIFPGQRLRIPGGRYHLVRPGEAGIAIARAYGVDWSRVATLNALTEPYILRTGQRILLPSAAEVSAMTLEERAAAFRLEIDDLITGGEPALAANAIPSKPVPTAARPLPPTATVGEPARFAGRFDWPLTGPILTRFGAASEGRRNDGIKIGAEFGAPVHAAADGVIAYAGSEIAVLGGLVLIRHGDGWITAYGHNSELLVTRGQAVKRGQTIARAGESGMVDKPQLHFEIRQARAPVDPLKYLPRS